MSTVSYIVYKNLLKDKMTELNENQFGPWKMSPNMKTIYNYMSQHHVGVENRTGMWDLAAHIVTAVKGQYLTNAKHEAHFEAIQRLKDNGLIKGTDGGWDPERMVDTVWIPVEGEKTPEELWHENVSKKFGMND